MKLISMTEFVLEQNKLPFYYYDALWTKVINYANFLKQPLELWMFVPCDEEGSVLEEPIYYELWGKYGSFTQYGEKIVPPCKKYQQAKERCLFEGFKYDNKMEYWHDSNISFDEEFCEKKTIEDIVFYNLILTQTAIKQIGL